MPFRPSITSLPISCRELVEDPHYTTSQTTWASRTVSVKTFHGLTQSCLLMFSGSFSLRWGFCVRYDSRYLTYLVHRRAQLLQITNYVCILNLPLDTEDFPALGIGSSEYLALLQTPLISAVQCFFAHQIYHLCRARVKWWVTAPIILSSSSLSSHGLALFDHGRSTGTLIEKAETAVLEYPNLSNRACQSSDQHLYADDGSSFNRRFGKLAHMRSGSALSRTKRLLNTLIIYAVNRCLLILLVAITALVMAVEGQDTWFLGLSFVIGRSSLNSREHLRSKGSSTLPDPRIGVAHFTGLLKVLGDVENFKDGARQVDIPEEDVIDITIYDAPDKTTKLCSEGKV
ncbi:hypothetical protein F5141DRAFT_1237767 [Pisolithus sp. B1]|nr:hypothetical protein F5141DRAFT_1237767 [Pisolithus sp. B1]